MANASKSIQELICGTDENWDEKYSPINGKRFFVSLDGQYGWRVEDRYSQLNFSSVIVVDLMRVCDAMNSTFPQSDRVS